MARLFTSGFELQSVSAGKEWSGVAAANPAIETTTKRSGAAALRCNLSGEAQIHTFTAAANPVAWVRLYFRVVTLHTNLTTIISRFRQGTNSKLGVQLTTGGLLQLFNEEDSAQIGANSSAISTGVWYRLELAIDQTTLASSVCEARLYAASDEATLLWNPSGTIDLSIAVTRVDVGLGTSSGFDGDIIYDDVAINDNSGSFQNSWPGEGEVLTLRPSGTGDNGGWARGGTDSGANWSQVEEITPDDVTTYVEEDTSGIIDDYNIDNTPAAMASDDTITCVQVGFRAAVSSATGADPDMVLRIEASAGGTIEESSAIDVNSTGYTTHAFSGPMNYFMTLYDLPGASTTAWTKADLDAAQIGVRESATDTHFILLTALWLTVDHKPAAAAPTVKPWYAYAQQ